MEARTDLCVDFMEDLQWAPLAEVFVVRGAGAMNSKMIRNKGDVSGCGRIEELWGRSANFEVVDDQIS